MDGGSSGRRSATHSKHSRFGSGNEEGTRRMDARRNGSAGCERIEQGEEVETEDEEFPMIPKTFVSAICLGLFALIAFASGEMPDRSRIAARRGARPVLEAVQTNAGIVVRSPGGEQFVASAPACSDKIDNCSD